MSFRVFLKQCAMEFFIITTCVNVASALFGPVLMPGREFGFYAFYSPLIAGIIGTLPSFIFYSKRELNLRETMIRKILHLAVLITTLTVFGWLNGNFTELSGALLFMLMVFLVYLVVNVIGWVLGNRDARQMNQGLKALQSRK